MAQVAQVAQVPYNPHEIRSKPISIRNIEHYNSINPLVVPYMIHELEGRPHTHTVDGMVPFRSNELNRPAQTGANYKRRKTKRRKMKRRKAKRRKTRNKN